jgi:ribokinase
MISVFGSINIDHTVKVDRLPRAGETVIGRTFQVGVGGKGANQAIAARRCGAPVTFHGSLGGDEWGRRAKQALLKANVGTEHLTVLSNQNTGSAYIYVDDEGENQIVILPGANAFAHYGAAVANGILVMQLEVPIAEVERAANTSRSRGAHVILNTAPIGPLSDHLLRDVDTVIGNELEILGKSDVSVYDAAAMASDYAARHGVTVVVTMGKRGAICIHGSHRFWVQAPPIKVVDTVGAGDGFVGAFAAGLHSGHDIKDCVSRAVSFGSAMCAVEGAQTAPPDALISRMVQSTIISDLH